MLCDVPSVLRAPRLWHGGSDRQRDNAEGIHPVSYTHLNIGQIPKFDKLIATIRSREISASIILQSQSQLKTIYKDAADTITGNCDCTLFLGGKEKSTLKEISEVLGKETIDLYNTSETRSSNNSYGLNYQKTGKELMSQDEIAVKMCIRDSSLSAEAAAFIAPSGNISPACLQSVPTARCV